VIISAARSGTKLLRRALASHPEVGAVPYDVNYLWRLGNESVPHDELDSPLPPQAKKVVGRELDRHGGSNAVVIEKTVSNCLRVPAVADALDDPLFVFLVRDGFDVTESAARQWLAPVDWKYTARKALAYPWLTAPEYALRHLRSMVSRRDPGAVATWGPRYDGIEADRKNNTLVRTCAQQWATCNVRAIEGFDAIDVSPLVVRYRDLVADPVACATRIYEFVGVRAIATSVEDIHVTDVGKGRRSLDADTISNIEPVLVPAQEALDNWITSHGGDLP